MELPSTYATSTLDEVLSDLSVRFIINLPQEELVSRERVCFQIEEAHWYYEDFVREHNPDFPQLSLNTFLGKIFAHNPMLSKWGMHQDAYREFMEYKHRVPVRGGILLNTQMDKVILVKGWKAGASWAFPRGKINKDEADHICAVREVLEETGFDCSELIDPSAFLVDSSEDSADRHLQLYLIKNVPEDFKFFPLARKEISEVAWFSITDLQTQNNLHRKRRDQTRNGQKSGAEDEEKVNKLRVFKVYGFLPGLVRWIKDQRRQMRQRGRNKKHGIMDETEPESSAVETSPPRQKKARDYHQSPKPSTPNIISYQQPPASESTVGPAGASGTQMDDTSLSLASAKLREMIGIGIVPGAGQAVSAQPDKVKASQSLLAQLQGPPSTTPKEPTQKPVVTGVSIPVSALFNASKQESQQNAQNLQNFQSLQTPQNIPSSQNVQNPQTPAQANFGPPRPTVSPNNNFNPSIRKSQQNSGARNGYGRNSQSNSHNQASKQPFTILQRGQPLPDKVFNTQPPVSSPVTHIPPQIPLTLPPQPSPVIRKDPGSPNAAGNRQIPTPPSQNSVSQDDASSANKMARRPLLTIDAFTPPQPAQPPSQEHKGNLLDILRGAKPPPPPQPAMQLQSDEASAAKPNTQSLNDILAGQGVKLPQPTAVQPNQPPSLETRPPVNGTQQKAADPAHLTNLMDSLLGRYVPKKITPPPTVNTNKMPAPPPVESVENRPVLSKPIQSPKPTPDWISPISPSLNGAARSPTNVSNPTLPRNTAGAEGLNKMTSFDRRSTIKPEQAQTLLGMFKAPNAGSSTPPGQLPMASPHTSAHPNPAQLLERPDKAAAPEMHRTGSVNLTAPEMSRSGSLSFEQTAFLMNFLDTLATQHGV
ncbi:mRNA-decapping enzyme subunit 2 [Orbilia ellipsospora]|uniref:mRNA-decapping enzyme subunit 2 n=1 Tax=Orbilia ellipsospora TaxID=2528407 RepID=A0AAV9X3A0_9PEZI